jgi:DNA replication protein DnaD
MTDQNINELLESADKTIFSCKETASNLIKLGLLQIEKDLQPNKLETIIQNIVNRLESILGENHDQIVRIKIFLKPGFSIDLITETIVKSLKNLLPKNCEEINALERQFYGGNFYENIFKAIDNCIDKLKPVDKIIL